MPAVTLSPSDLSAFADIDPLRANALIQDALALAAFHAPCIMSEDFQYAAVAKAILRRAILRCNEAGTGASVQQSAGPFSQTIDTRKDQRDALTASEVEQLKALCQGAETSGAFSVDTVGTGVWHADICSLNFGALYCSCGASLSLGYPLYEVYP